MESYLGLLLEHIRGLHIDNLMSLMIAILRACFLETRWNLQIVNWLDPMMASN